MGLMNNICLAYYWIYKKMLFFEDEKEIKKAFDSEWYQHITKSEIVTLIHRSIGALTYRRLNDSRGFGTGVLI